MGKCNYWILLGILITACSGSNGGQGGRGRRGPRGNAGTNGTDGTSCSVMTVSPSEITPTGGALITCGEGASLLVNGIAGTNGNDGEDGNDGTNGTNGTNGTAGLSAYELWLSLGNSGSLSTYLNTLKGATGATGPQGLQGAAALPSAYSIVAIMNPCGNNGSADEVLLRFSNGTVLASVSDDWTGHNTRLAVLTSGNYFTTDGFACNFSVVIGAGTGAISWLGGGLLW